LVVTTGMRSETSVRMRCAKTNGVRQEVVPLAVELRRRSIA
jgi:hypothetical protein